MENVFITAGLVAFNYILFQIIHIVLGTKSKRYAKIAYHQQRYVVKNLAKSAILMCLLIAVIPSIWMALWYDIWNNRTIYMVGNIYVSIDLSGLLFVPKLPTTTKIHHSCVLILGTINVFMDYTEPRIASGILLSGSF